MNCQRKLLARRNSALKPGQIKRLCSVQFQRLSACAVFKLTRQHAHTHQIRSMNALKALSNNRTYAQQTSSLCRPITRASSSIFLPRKHHQWYALRLILHRRVVDVHSLAVRLVNSDTAFDAGNHQILDPYVCEGSTSHNPIISSTRAVAVEIRHTHASGLKIDARW